MNDESEGGWKKRPWSISWYHLGIHLKVMRNNEKNLTHDKRLPGGNYENSSIFPL
jgi:hypothetical protein